MMWGFAESGVLFCESPIRTIAFYLGSMSGYPPHNMAAMAWDFCLLTVRATSADARRPQGLGSRGSSAMSGFGLPQPAKQRPLYQITVEGPLIDLNESSLSSPKP